MKIALGTDVANRDQFAQFLIAHGIDAVLGDNSDDAIDSVTVKFGNSEYDILQSRWTDFCSGKINAFADGVKYINHKYVRHNLARMITKPVVLITFPLSEKHAQFTSEIVGLAPVGSVSYKNDLIARVEAAFPSINCIVEYRDNQAMVKMSKLARRTCNATDAEIAAAAGFSL